MSQIRYREKQQRKAARKEQLQVKEVQLQMGSPLKVEATTPIKDGDARRSSNSSAQQQPQQPQSSGHRRDNSSSMAKRAAGFSTGQEAAPNMAAILSGMGADTPKEVGAVGGP